MASAPSRAWHRRTASPRSAPIRPRPPASRPRPCRRRPRRNPTASRRRAAPRPPASASDPMRLTRRSPVLPRFTPLLVPALLLAGCGTYNGGVESVHQPIVQRNDYVLDLQTAGYGLAPGESRRLAGWMSAMSLRYGDRVAIDDGAAGATGRDEIAAEAGRYGLILADRAPVTASQIAPGTVRVVVTRMAAKVPGCPDNSRPAEYT